MKNKLKKTLTNLLTLFFLLILAGCSSQPEGIYRVGTSSKNSFISFSPPNKHHSDYITWVGNRRGKTSNCKTKGSYTYNKKNKTIIVSGLYNGNCPEKSNLNGEWKYEGSYVVNPRGVKYKKD